MNLLQKQKIQNKNCTRGYFINTPKVLVGETRCPHIDNNAPFKVSKMWVGERVLVTVVETTIKNQKRPKPTSAHVAVDEKQSSALLS